MPTGPFPRPRYHASPPYGWMNDPNGLCFFKGEYHLFFQHNPKAPRWGRMYWGHATSPDLISWTYHEPALKPGGFWDSFLGCFSGSAQVHDGRLHLFYTGVSLLGQYQCHAVSDDGRHFRKSQHPSVGPGNLPPMHGALHFRDPKVFRQRTAENDSYFMLIGGRARNRISRISLYRSVNLQDWSYIGAVLEDQLPRGGVFECPDLVTLSNKDILFASAMYLPRSSQKEFENLHSALWITGTFNADSASFIPDAPYREIDAGTDYYAPQTLETPDGRIVQIAWMDMWKRSRPSAESGWVGCMTIPRELRYKKGRLLQNPVKELERYRTTRHNIAPQRFTKTMPISEISGDALDLNLSIDISRAEEFGIRLFQNQKQQYHLEIRYSRETRNLVCDRSRIRHRIETKGRQEGQSDIRSSKPEISGGILRLRIIIDGSCVETFAGDGEICMSVLAFHGPQDDGMELFCEGEAGIIEFEVFELDGFQTEIQ